MSKVDEIFNNTLLKPVRIDVTEQLQPIGFIDYACMLTMSLKNNKDRLLKNFWKDKTTTDYYYLVSEKDVFPDEILGKYLLLRMMNWLPEKTEKTNPDTPQDRACVFNFYVYDVRENIEDIKNYTGLNGFYNVINNNRYYEEIPLINNLYHQDNGVLSYTHLNTFVVRDTRHATGKKDYWSKFTINLETRIKSPCIEPPINQTYSKYH